MAYLNINNYCSFEGRLAKDVELSEVTFGANTLPKVKFTIAVDKNLGKEQKEKATQAGQPTADFIQCECVGPKATFISKFFQKGSGIRVVATYRSYTFESQGEKRYGHSFDVVDAGFTIGGNAQGNTQGAPQSQGASQGDLGAFAGIGAADIPF